MRVERSGAGSYAHSIYSKHLIGAALTRAMADIDQSVSTSTSSMFPEWDVLVSGTGGAEWLGRGKVLDYIPDSMTNIVSTNGAGWIDIEDTNNSVVGRCAYIIVNTSGLLDANRAGGASRGWGTNASEIQLDGLPEINSTANASIFTNDRALDGRYEDLAELRYLNSGLQNKVCSNFVTYSLAPDQKYVRSDGTLADKAYVGGDLGYLQSAVARTNILQHLAESGIVGPDAAEAKNTAYLNLLDYVDANCIPQQFNAGCSELVPMINEVIVECEATVAGGICTVASALSVEWFYPFDVSPQDPPPGQFRMDIVKMTAVADGGNTTPLLLPVFPATYSENVTVGGTPFGSVTVNPPDRSILTNMANAIRMAFTVEVKAKVQHLASGQWVDIVPFPEANPGIKLKFDFTVPAVGPGNATVLTQEWAECIDPRFNWDSQNTGGRDQWAYSGDLRGAGAGVPAASSLNSMNEYTKYVLSDPTKTFGVEFDGTNDMQAAYLYVANRPLRSVGELGYITIRPWSTIRLYDHCSPNPVGGEPAYHRVLDCFTMFPASVVCRQGLVNINTYSTNALAAVFFKVPEKEYATGGARLSGATASSVAQQIFEHGPYTNLSEIGGALTNWWTTNAPTDTAREGPIRNSAGLLTTRQNLFTVILVVGTTSRGMGYIAGQGMGDWLSCQKAVALVWRDPFPQIQVQSGQKTTNHWWFVRHLNILDE